MNFLKKRYFWLALLIFSFTITGCYSIHTEQRVNQDGSGSIKITYDLTQFMMMQDTQGFGNEEAEVLEDFEGPDFEGMCEEFYEQGFGLTDKECVIEEYVVTVSGNIPPGALEIIEEENAYTYYLKQVYDFMAPIDEDGFSEMNDEEILMMEDLRGMGLTMELIVIFDGTIIETDAPLEYDGNELFIDFFELARTENPSVKVSTEETIKTPEQTPPPTNGEDDQEEIPETEEESNNLIIIVLSAIVLIGIIGIIILKTKKKNNVNTLPQTTEPEKQTEEQKPQEQQTTPPQLQENTTEITPKIQKIIDSIKKYETQYSEETLRKNLEKNPSLNKEEIDLAFRYK